MKYYLIKESSEIPLKSWRTRPKFERALSRAIEYSLKKVGASFKLSYSEGVFFLEADQDVSHVLTKVFGIHDLCEVVPHRFTSLDEIVAKAEELFRDAVAGKKFAVRVKRHGDHPFTSLDVARAVGSRLLQYSAGVDLEAPDIEVKIEVRDEWAYYVLRCWRGLGGLPVGTEGRALTLFSGGFDSTLASFLAAKRGAEVDFLHFYMGSSESTLAAIDVMRGLSEFLAPYEPVAIFVNLVPVLAELKAKVEGRIRQVVLRVIMHEIGQEIAGKYGYDAVVTGESVGQASSQTLRNLKVVDSLINLRTALLRPLACLDKEEIVSKVRELGLYDAVVRVEEVCKLSEGPVETRARIDEVEEAVTRISKDVIEGVVANAKTYKVGDLNPEVVLKELGADIEVDDVPENWVLVDIRDKSKYLKDHIPGAIHISELGEDVSKPVVLYCEFGSASLLAAMELRKLGREAYSLRGGFAGYRKRRSADIGCARSPAPGSPRS